MFLRLCHSAVTSVGPKYTHRPSSSVMTVLPHRMVVTAAIAYSRKKKMTLDAITPMSDALTTSPKPIAHALTMLSACSTRYGTSAHSAPVA